jgi:hypothetical protein
VGYWILRAYKRDRVVTVIGYLNRARKPTAFTVDQKCESAGYNCPVLHDAFEAPVSKQNVSKRVLKQFQNAFRNFPGTVTQVDGNRIQVRAAITFPMGSRGCSVDVPIPVLGRIPILLSDGRTVASPVPVDVPVTVPEGSELPKLPVFSGFIAPVSAPLPAPVPAPLFPVRSRSMAMVSSAVVTATCLDSKSARIAISPMTPLIAVLEMVQIDL